MNRMKDSFKASSGATPPVLVGRDDSIDDFELALTNGPGTHERISVITGARRVGKTVLLNAFEDIAANSKLATTMVKEAVNAA